MALQKVLCKTIASIQLNHAAAFPLAGYEQALFISVANSRQKIQVQLRNRRVCHCDIADRRDTRSHAATLTDQDQHDI